MKMMVMMGKVGIAATGDDDEINSNSENDEQKKVLVILSDGFNSGTDVMLRWLPNALALVPGDELIALLFNPATPSPPFSAFTAAAAKTKSSYKGKHDTVREFGSSRRRSEAEELRRTKQLQEEYLANSAIVHLQKLCQIHQIKVTVEVEAGSSRKSAAVRAAKKLKATWVVLDREMKKDKQYFLDRLSCGISSMKSNNTIKKLRGPANEHVSYDEMNPSYSWEASSPSKSPGDRKPVTCKESNYCCPSEPLQYNAQAAGSASSQLIAEKSISQPTKPAQNYHKESHKMLKHNRGIQKPDKVQTEKQFGYSICSVCHNKRPKCGLQWNFTYVELYEVTNGFSKDNFISEGGFGSVYKGRLRNGIKVAVKQLKAASLQGEKEFKSEVQVLSQVRHQNLVMLLGSCARGTHRLLVYEYICNGSLEEHLSGNTRPLNWEQRVKIAAGAAKGLAYLHARNIVHRDVRPGNILITHDHESLLGDFGLAKTQDNINSCDDTHVVGTLGYMAPEYAECGRLSTKTDVYSFGVVLLQLITGLSTTDEIPGGKSLVGWAKPLLESKNYPDLIDKRILDSQDVHQLFWMVVVAEKCLKKDPNNRWTMEQVVHNLKCIKEGNTNFSIDFSPRRGETSNR